MTALVIPIQVKRGPAAGLPTLLAGEWGMTDDTFRMYFGDGTANHQIALSSDLSGFQPLDAELTALAGLTSAADRVPYFTGSGTAGLLTRDVDTALTANSDTVLATQKAVKAYVDNAVVGLLDFKGSTDCSASPNYPSALKGDAYVVSVAGKIGGASGVSVDLGDMFVAKADNAGGTQASVGTSWTVLEHNLTGALLAANNLSDVASASTSRSNLGLGTSAVIDTGTSGTKVPLLDGNNTWGGTNVFAATGLAVADVITPANKLSIASSGCTTASRTLTFNVNDAARVINLSGTLTVSSAATVSGTNTGDQSSVSGNAGTATALATGRTIAMTGDVTWTSPSFDGSGNVTAAGTIAANAVTLAKLATQAADTILANATTGAAVPTAVAIAASQIVGRTAASRVKGMTGTETTALLDAFVAAGGSAAKGVVPSPGATAYTNHPRLLGSQAAFVAHSGKILGDAPVTTQETTTSTTFVDLTTTQSVAFTLDVAGDVLVIATAAYVNTAGAGNVGLLAADVDGSDTVISQTSPISTTSIQSMAGTFSFSLASGAHTIKLQFRVSGGTGQFSNRNVIVVLKA